MSRKQHTESSEEVVSNADTGYETSSIFSASSSSEISKQAAVETNIEIPGHIISQVRRKYSTITSVYKRQCPCLLRNIASLELIEGCPNDERGSCNGLLVHLPYSSLFKRDHDRKDGDSKRILVVGEAGIGKSVLSALIAEDWANGKLFQEFLLAFLLPLNHRGIASSQSLPELFKNLEFDSKVSLTIATYLMGNRKDNILMIADGWDELCELDSSKESFLSHLLFGDLLPGSSLTVIVMSRTASVPQQSISQFITIQGFSEETVKSYIQCEFSSNSEKLSNITKQLESNPLVGSMCSIPLNVALICNYCQSCDDSLPSTMPELYSKLAWNLVQLKISNAKKYETLLKLTNHQDLPSKSQHSWSCLCRLAYENCQADFSPVAVSRHLSIDSELETFGLLKPIITERNEETLSFLCPGFRYYLAILHLTSQPQSVQLEEVKSLPRMSPMFCRFYLSMSEDASSDIISEVVSKLHHCCKDMCLLSFESNNEIVDQEVIRSLLASDSTIMLHAQNAYECMAMAHILEKIEQPSNVEINFQTCKLKAKQILKLASILRSQSNMIQIKGLDLSDNGLNDTMIADFFSGTASVFGSLEKLFLRRCGIGEKALSAIIDALVKSSCNSLTQLDLSFNSLSVACLECFQSFINKNNLQKMEILILKGSLAEDINVSFLKCFATTLSTKCRCLRRFDLSGNKLSMHEDPDLSTVISQLTTNLGTNFDLRLDDDYMSEVEKNFLTIMEESIRTKGTIDHTIAHGVIVGPGRSGKDTLMKRLTGEGPPQPGTISSSTGVLENIVKVEVKKLCTVATAVCNLKWQRLEYDKEALELMMTTAKNYSCMGSVQTPVIIKYVNKLKAEEEMESPLQPPDHHEISKVARIEGAKAIDILESTNHIFENEDKESNNVKHVVVYRDDLAPVDIFKQAVKLRRMDALREHLESSWSLYLTNTGGQIEFQEHLPLLVCGPSIFFVIFPLHHDLDEPYEVRYEYPDGFVKKYSSTPTLIQELFQTLSTIYALDYASIQIGDDEVQLKPKIFFVGTHKDCLPGPESAREKKIKQIDRRLQNEVKQTSLFHQGSIQFAHSSKQMIFTVNNLSEDDDDFQKIRFAVQQTVEKKCYSEFTVQCPSSWLIFSLILRAKHMSNQVLEFEECFKIAQECGISTRRELTTALSFIHSRLGLVRHFNVKELDSLVVIDPQVLFDKITDLIVETFITEEINVEENEIEEFREKGIISVAVMKRISEQSNYRGVKIPFTWITTLLNHLRIAALFKDYQGEKYFFPSALCHVPEADDSSSDSSSLDSFESQANLSPPFLIAFETGFCPRGMAGALVKCLMTNEMKSNRKWELLPKRIFRNEVSFHIEACGDITIKVLPTHLEITIDSDDGTDCEEAYTQISKSMNIATTLYKKCEFFYTFYCTLDKCKKNPHPARIEWKHNTPSKLRCKILNKSGRLPKGYKLWNLQKKDMRSRSNTEIHYEDLGPIADSIVEWKGPIADKLKLTPSDVADIETKYPQKLKLQSREALYTWKKRNGSKATYRELAEVFDRAGCKHYADEVRRIANMSDSESDDSSINGEEQPKTYPTPHKGFCQDLEPGPAKSEVYVMVEEENLLEGVNVGEACSEKLLDSQTATFVPQLIPNDSKSDQDHTEEQHPHKDTSNEHGLSNTTQLQLSNIPELKEFILDDIHRTGTTLGHGALGVVEELLMGGTLCAGKRLHPALLNICNEPEGTQRTIKRFIEECSLMSKMRHPRIVQFLGLCFFDDSPYPMLVMEKVSFSLETVLEMQKNIAFPLILQILQDIAEGLIYLHSQRPPVIHRDLTARNVLIDQRSFRAKISDLGNFRLCLADHMRFTQTLTQAPGTLSYMSPEALVYKQNYDTKLDMFSFGHLALFAVIQEFPKDLEAPTYYEDGIIKGRSEVERRQKYLAKLNAKLTKDHVVTKMIYQCLHNLPKKRPTAKQLMEQIASVSTIEDDVAYGQVNLVELINKVDKREPKAAYYETPQDDGGMKRRIENYKHGAPGVLEIFQVISKRQTWQSHMFRIKDGALNYYRQEMVDEPHDSINLSSIAAVKACPPKETWNKSMFYFQVHFSDVLAPKMSPWLLRAHTQDDRTCWMEAISAGSSATLPTAPESQYAYEPVTPIPESEMYSYSYTRISARSELKHHSQAKTKRARPLPIIEEFVPDLGNQKATSTSQYVDETVSDDEEPIYDDIADSTAGDDEEPIYDDIFDLTEKNGRA